MTDQQPIAILKNAILLKTRGRTLYQSSAEKTQHPSVKAFFEGMAEEESRHIQILSDQYRTYQKG
jgi:rubrerythrin